MAEPVKPFTTLTPSFCARLGGVFYFVRGAAIDGLGITVAPNVRRQNRFVADVDVVAHRLANEVRTDGVQLQIVFLQQFALALAVAGVGNGFVDFEMIAPTGQFQTVVTKFAGFARDGFQRQIGPLTREQRDRTCHTDAPA